MALSNIFPEARSVGAWLKGGWHVAVGYVLGYFALLLVAGWHPHSIKHDPDAAAPVPAITAPAPQR